jgi:hypothetical protein
MSLTLLEARTRLGDYAGINLTDSQVTDRINAVRERFFNSGKWNGMLAQYDFGAPGSQITLPRDLLSVLGVQFDNIPQLTYPLWHEFIASGPGQISPTMGMQMLIDRGDGFCTFLDPETPFRVRVKTEDAQDTGITIRLFGTDSSNRSIYDSTGASGIDLSVGGTTTTTVTFKTLTSVNKPLTEGYLTLWAVDPTTNVETQIALYEPSETKICYRRYFVAGIPVKSSLRCMCKRRYVPLTHSVDDNKQIMPSNEGALKLGLIALQYEDKNDLERADNYMARAISLLNSELKEERGSAIVRIQFNPNGSTLKVRQMY